MQVIDDGKHLLVYSNGVKAFNDLPTKNNYSVEFEDGMNGVGFFLRRSNLFKKPNFKLYGNSLDMVDTVMDTFKSSDKSVGIILSGAKGTGKTIFSKMLSIKANQVGLPTVLVNSNKKGVSEFLSQIDQSCLVMFDEFEKKFQDSLQSSGDSDNQNDLLSLFDGVLGGKNIYVITVNEIAELSPYLLNRPGRFMYAIRMAEPSLDDINQYLEDKLSKKVINRQEQIKQIVQFGLKFPLSYDILDTLVLQLNAGRLFKKALPSLNLMDFGDVSYNIKIIFENGYSYTVAESNVDLFDEIIKINDSDISFDFQSSDLVTKNNKLVVSGSNIRHISANGTLKNKIQRGLGTEAIKQIEIKPKRSDDFGFNI